MYLLTIIRTCITRDAVMKSKIDKHFIFSKVGINFFI